MRISRPSAARLRAIDAARTEVAAETPDDEVYKTTLELRDPADGSVRALNVSKFQIVPGLRLALRRAVVRYSKQPTVKSFESVKAFSGSLSGGLVQFAAETGRKDITLVHLDRQTLAAMIGWLNLTENDVARLTNLTRMRYYSAVVQMLDLLRGDKELRSHVIDVNDVPVAPWNKRERTSLSLSHEMQEHELRAVFLAAARAVRRTSAELREDLALDGPHPAALAERREVIELVRQHVRSGTLTFSQVVRRDPALSRRVEKLDRNRVMRAARPDPEDLVPYMVLFTIAFRLNSTVLFSAKRTDFDVRPWIGGDRIVARPFKPRAGRRQTASSAVTGEAINPSSMLGLLDVWLEPLRSHLGSDTLFQYLPKKTDKPIVVDTVAKPGGEYLLTLALRRFAAKSLSPGDEVEIKKLTFSRIRKAVLDLAHSVSKGDLLKVKAAANHASIQTTGDHYVSAAGMAREDEALARAMSSQVRMIGTGALFDPRRLVDEVTEACTPGWSCDRRGAPAPGPVRSDGQCVSYGRCPICVHGRIDFRSPKACAQSHHLVDAIERAIENMPPAAWLARLSPIRMHLMENVIPRFTPEVHDRAMALELPQLPSPE